MCIGDVTEEDMLHKLLEHEEHGHEKDSGGVVFLRKGDGSLPWSDGEERGFGDSGSGGSDDVRRPGRSEDWRRPGSGSGSGSGREMPVRRVGVVEGFSKGIQTTVCGRLEQIQPVRACAGKDTLEQGDP